MSPDAWVAIPQEAPYVEATAMDGDYRILSKKFIKNPKFVEGLELVNNTHLLMSSGMYGSSFLQLIDLESMEVVKEHALDSKYFGEGITRLDNGDIFMLTYRSRVVFKFND